jgi:serine protease Do
MQIPRGFEPFFNFPQQRQQQPQIERGSGSGFFVTEEGDSLSNNHVVDGAEKVTVQLLDHRSFPAKVIGTDPTTDVAVIKIDARGLDPADLGSSAATKIGEWVLAVGNPLGENLTFTVTSGIISAKGRGRLQLPGYTDRSIQDFIQTDAAINPGNSGGPLVNCRGEIIGINSAIASETGYNVGYGFAIPIDLARQVMDQLIKNGKVERAALGVYVQDVTPTDAKYLGLTEVRGVRLSKFSSDDSPAEKAGLVPGDVILAIDGHNVDYTAQLQQIVAFKHPGETVRVEVARKGGERRTFTVRLISQGATGQQTAASDNTSPDESSDKAGEEPAAAKIRSLGLSVVPLTTALAGELGYPATIHGVLVQNVDPEGPAAQDVAGTNNSDTPDVIIAVEGTPIHSSSELNAALRHPGPGGIVTLQLYNKSGGKRVERVQLGN